MEKSTEKASEQAIEQASQKSPFGKFNWKDWRIMVPAILLILLLVFVGYRYHVDHKVIAGGTVVIGLLSGAFAWLVGIIGLVPIIGPILVKVLSIGFIWLLNAVGYVISYIAIKRGYSQDVLTYRGLTIALIVGIIIGYIIAQYI
jgi:hypothetical protein